MKSRNKSNDLDLYAQYDYVYVNPNEIQKRHFELLGNIRDY